MACLPHPGQPETQKLSRWLKDFFLPHNPVKGQQGGQFSGFLVSQAWSPLRPVRMCPPAAVGVQLGPQGSLEEGSVCPACGADSRQLIGGGARLGGEGSVWPLDVGVRPTFQSPH